MRKRLKTPQRTPRRRPEETTATGGGAGTGQNCGGLQGIVCASAADFCKFAAADMCGAADAMGICTTKPEICPTDYMPVCGCDGNTYGNACEADRAGVSITAQGECPKSE